MRSRRLVPMPQRTSHKATPQEPKETACGRAQQAITRLIRGDAVSVRRGLVAYLALFVVLGGTSYAATRLARVRRTCYPPGTGPRSPRTRRDGSFFRAWLLYALVRLRVQAGHAPENSYTRGGPTSHAFEREGLRPLCGVLVGFVGRGPSEWSGDGLDMVTGHRTFSSERTGFRLRQLGAEAEWLGRMDRVRCLVGLTPVVGGQSSRLDRDGDRRLRARDRPSVARGRRLVAVLDGRRLAAVGPVSLGARGERAMTRFRRLRWVAGGAVAAVLAVSAAGAVAASAGSPATQPVRVAWLLPEGLHHDRPGQGGAVLPLR